MNRREQREVEVAAEHARDFEQHLPARRQEVETPENDVAQRVDVDVAVDVDVEIDVPTVRRADHETPVPHRQNELLGVERQAFASRVDMCDQPWRRNSAAKVRSDQFADRLAVEPRQRSPQRAVAQQGLEFGRHPGLQRPRGGHDEQSREPRQQRRQQPRGGPVEPVRVVEQQHNAGPRDPHEPGQEISNGAASAGAGQPF